MATIQKSIMVKAPVEKVFAFMEDPHNLPEVWPSLIEVHDVKPNSKGGYDYGWTYKMAGMKFEGASEIIEYAPNQRIATKSSKGIENAIAWTFKAADGGTQISVNTEYRIPVPLLGKLAEAVIVRQNEQETNTICDNIKNMMEMKTSVTA